MRWRRVRLHLEPGFIRRDPHFTLADLSMQCPLTRCALWRTRYVMRAIHLHTSLSVCGHINRYRGEMRRKVSTGRDVSTITDTQRRDDSNNTFTILSSKVSNKCYLSLTILAFLLSLRSPSANHRQACHSCNTFTTCLNTIPGVHTTVIHQGTVSLILFALATSIAAAEKICGTFPTSPAPSPPAILAPPIPGTRGFVLLGEEKQSRYNPMKNNSLNAQAVKRTHCAKSPHHQLQTYSTVGEDNSPSDSKDSKPNSSQHQHPYDSLPVPPQPA